MLKHFNQRCFLMADAPRGGGGDDRYERDDFLAASFKFALNRAKGSSTANPPHLIEAVESILDRLQEAGHFILVSSDLQPIARRIAEIKGYSDKRNPHILQTKFKDFDLSVDPNLLAPPTAD